MRKPGDSYAKEFTTASPTTGAAADADSLPVATADFDGTGTGSMALTVTHLDAGRYKITGTVPGTRVSGDILNVSVAATVGGVAGKAVVDTQSIDSKRVGDLNDAPAVTAAQVRQEMDASSIQFAALVAADTLFGRLMGTGHVTSVTSPGAFAVAFDSAYLGNQAALTDGTLQVSFATGLNQWHARSITGGALNSSTAATLTFGTPFSQAVAIGDLFAIITD